MRDAAGAPLAPETGSYVDATPVGAGRVALGWATTTRGGVQIFDLRRRLALDVGGESLLELGNVLRALAADADGRLWALTRNEVLEIGGGPMEAAYAPDGTRFEPSMPNPDPLRVMQRFARPAGAQGTNPVFAADSRRLYVVDDTTGDPPAIWTRPIAGAPGVEAWRRLPLVDDDGAPLPFPCDGAALGDDRVALLAVPAAGLDPAGSDVDAAVVEIDEEGGVARLVGERFPLRALLHPRFVRGPSAQVFWRAPDGLRGGDDLHPRFGRHRSDLAPPLRRGSHPAGMRGRVLGARERRRPAAAAPPRDRSRRLRAARRCAGDAAAARAGPLRRRGAAACARAPRVRR